MKAQSFKSKSKNGMITARWAFLQKKRIQCDKTFGWSIPFSEAKTVVHFKVFSFSYTHQR